MTHSYSFFLTNLCGKDDFSMSPQVAYARELDWQIRIDRLSQVFERLSKESVTIKHQINELKNLQETIQRLSTKI